MADGLRELRQRAAAASGGASDEVIYAAILRVLGDLDLGGDALDFGAGQGTLSHRLAASGRFRSLCAADLLDRPPGLDVGIRWVQADLNEPLELASQSFDTIVAAEVVEHLENPRAAAREWFRLLRPGGSVVLSTPNNESWRALGALLLRGHFVAFGDTAYPAHITALLRKDVERLLQEAGFERLEFAFTDVGGLPKLPSITWQRISLGLLRGRRYSDNLLAWARKPG
jgi:2-polyprenyl-3-methyl-5-hydroxy-6-metoxy-1,4-benzoquinol methylase